MKHIPKANRLIVRARKYFSIMKYFSNISVLNYFFLSNKRLVGFSVVSQIFCYSRSFKASKVFQGLSVTQRLSPSLSRITANRLKGFFKKHIWICEFKMYISYSGEKTTPLSKKYFDMMSSTALLELNFYLQKFIFYNAKSNYSNH